MNVLRALMVVVALLTQMVVPAMTHAAEEADCCVYDPSTNLPDWFEENLDGRYWFEGVTPTSQCKLPANVVAISKYGSFFSTPQKTPGACSATKQWKDYEAQMKVIHCYVVRDAANKVKSCINEPKTTNLLQKSFYVVTKDAASTDRVILEESPCNKVNDCQVYLKAKAEAEAKLAAIAEAKKQLGPGHETDWIEPWTKDECLKVKGMDGKPKYVWIPPKKNPDVQVGNYCYITPMRTDLEIDIGEHTFVAGATKYINVAYKYAIGLAVLFAVVTIIYAGFQWMLSGIADKVQDAKDKIQSAVLGLLLILSAYTLLNTINPQLTQLRTPPMQAIKPLKFAVDAQIACDPSAEKNSPEGCGKYGDNFFCKPTVYGFKESCAERMKTFVAVMSAPAAIALGGAVAADIGLFSNLTQINWETATCVLGEKKASGFQEFTSCTAESTLSGKGKLLVGAAAAIATAAGVVAALPDDASDPPKGFCVQGNYDKADGLMCSYDNECQSRKCLISKITCGGQNYGVCTSGKPREPCSTENGKYGCASGTSCVMNGIGVNKVGIGVGFCSDGTLGMACNENVGCKAGLECIKGYCREVGYFNEDTGSVKKFGAGKPSCIFATECLPESICTYAGKSKCNTASVGVVGCLKPPSGDGTLPARFLQSSKAGALDKEYFQELLSVGSCVVQGGMYGAAQQGGVSKGMYCFANVRPYQGKLLGIVTAFKENGYAVAPEWENGVEIAAVGCGNMDVCRVSFEGFKSSSIKIAGGRASVTGSCVPGPSDSERYAQAMTGGLFSIQGKAIWFTKDGKNLVVEYEDEKFKVISLPGFTDLANILAQPNILAQ